MTGGVRGTAERIAAVAEGLLRDHPRAGVLYGVGVGPGDPGLLTVRGAALLGRLDVVGVPRSDRGEGIARHAVAPWVGADRVVELVSDMPVDTGDAIDGWRRRIGPLLEALDGGRTCGVVCDGDPALYSTFAMCSAAVVGARPATRVVSIPGVPAMCAAAAGDGRRPPAPLVLGAERLVVLPLSRVDDASAADALDRADCLVLLKPAGALARLRALLAGPARGWEVHVARRVGLPGEAHGGAEALDLAEDYMSVVTLRRPGTLR